MIIMHNFSFQKITIKEKLVQTKNDKAFKACLAEKCYLTTCTNDIKRLWKSIKMSDEHFK